MAACARAANRRLTRSGRPFYEAVTQGGAERRFRAAALDSAAVVLPKRPGRSAGEFHLGEIAPLAGCNALEADIHEANSD